MFSLGQTGPSCIVDGLNTLRDCLDCFLIRFDFVWGQIRPRDFCWASEGNVVPLTDYIDDLKVRIHVHRTFHGCVWILVSPSRWKCGELAGRHIWQACLMLESHVLPSNIIFFAL